MAEKEKVEQQAYHFSAPPSKKEEVEQQSSFQPAAFAKEAEQKAEIREERKKLINWLNGLKRVPSLLL